MFANPLSVLKFSYLFLATILSVAAYGGQKKIKVIDESGKIIEIPEDIAKSIKTIDNLITDLGGYENYITKEAEAIPVKFSSEQFEKIITFLSEAKKALNLSDDDDLSKIPNQQIQNAVEKKIEAASSSPNDLLEIIKMASYLDVAAIINAGTKVWAKKYSAEPSSFHELNNDLKQIIINLLSPQAFITLTRANPTTPAGLKQEENSYKVALRSHYDEKELPMGLSAKEHYEQLYYLPLVENLKNYSRSIREAAAEELRKNKPTDPTVISALVELLKNENSNIRYVAARLLAGIGLTNPTIESALSEALNDKDADVRFVAINALEATKPLDVQLALDITLGDADDNTRARAERKLKELKPTDPKIQLALVESLRYQNARPRAFNLLREFQPTDPTVISALVELLKNENSNIRYVAARLLAEIGLTNPTIISDPAVISALIKVLQNKYEGDVQRWWAAKILASVKPTDQIIEEAFTQALQDKDPDIR